MRFQPWNGARLSFQPPTETSVSRVHRTLSPANQLPLSNPHPLRPLLPLHHIHKSPLPTFSSRTVAITPLALSPRHLTSVWYTRWEKLNCNSPLLPGPCRGNLGKFGSEVVRRSDVSRSITCCDSSDSIHLVLVFLARAALTAALVSLTRLTEEESKNWRAVAHVASN